MGDDVERIVVGNQRTEVQTCHVLNTIFSTYARGKSFVGTHLVAQGLDLLQELGMTLTEGLFALFRTSVEHCSISEDNPGRYHHTVAVGMHTAVHTRGIVDHDTTHHRRTDRGRVRREHAPVRFQDLIHLRTHDTWLKFDCILILTDLIFLPVLASHDQHTLGTALS